MWMQHVIARLQSSHLSGFQMSLNTQVAIKLLVGYGSGRPQYGMTPTTSMNPLPSHGDVSHVNLCNLIKLDL